MTSGPIEKRLRSCIEGDDVATRRAGELLRALPDPGPLSESARRRTLRALRASSRTARGFHFTALQWAVLSVLLVSTAAAAKRVWFPNGFGRHASVGEGAADAVVASPAPPRDPPKWTPTVIEASPPPKDGSRASAAKARASSPSKSEPARPRLLSDPQQDAIPRVLPRLVYDAETYSVLLDVCVSAQGRVTKASVVRGQETALDRDIVEAVRRWNYLPAEADGKPAPTCFPLVYRIQVQRD